MCQQWFSVVGNLTEIVGFLLVVREWYHVFSLDALQRRNRIERFKLQEEPRRPKVENGLIPVVRNTEMWRELRRLLNRDLRYRRRIFFGGSALVVSRSRMSKWRGAGRAAYLESEVAKKFGVLVRCCR